MSKSGSNPPIRFRSVAVLVSIRATEVGATGASAVARRSSPSHRKGMLSVDVGQAAVSGGDAQITLSSLTVSTHSISAKYSGDA